MTSQKLHLYLFRFISLWLRFCWVLNLLQIVPLATMSWTTNEENSDLWEIRVWGEQNVLGFQIAVDDVLAVQVLQGYQDLKHQHGDEEEECMGQ